MKSFRMIGAACFALALCTAGAMAQVADPPAPSNVVDFGPILNTVIGIVATTLLGLLNVAAGFGINWVRSKTGLVSSQMAESAQARFNEAARRSMAYAESKVKSKLGDGKVEIDNAFVRTAAEYFKEFWPDLVEGLDLDQIGKTIVARLPSGPMATAAENVANKAPPVAVVPAAATESKK